MSKAAHTPVPWRVKLIRPNKDEGHAFEPRCSILAANPEPGPHYSGDIRIADIPDPYTAEEEANAAFICKAVNCHDELLAQLKQAEQMLSRISDGETYPATEYLETLRTMSAAISKATKGATHA